MHSFLARDTVVGEVCDDNVCACAVSALILFPVANLSPKMDFEDPSFLQCVNISPVNQRLKAILIN